jgi:ATP-dependent DNA helicase RecG
MRLLWSNWSAIVEEEESPSSLSDFFGIRQSGMMEFQIGDVFNDAAVLAAASKECDALLKSDPQLNYEKNSRLRSTIRSYRMIAEKKINI